MSFIYPCKKNCLKNSSVRKNFALIILLFIPLFLLINSKVNATIQNEFHPIPVLQGSTPLLLQPIESVRINDSEIISFGMPFPKGYLTDLTTLKVLNSQGNEVAIFVKVLSPWRDISTATDENSFRSVLVQLEVTYRDNDDNGEPDPLNLTVEWGGTQRLTDDLLEVDTRNNWRLVDNELYKHNELVYEPPVYAVFSSEWYGLSVIKTRLLPKESHADFAMYEDVFTQFSNTAIQRVDPRVSQEYLNNYTTAYASWLFDRAMTLYQVALKNADYALLRESHRASQFFANHINSLGYFDLKTSNDLKYSHAEGLATNYWLTGSESSKNKISKMVNAFDSFDMNYTLETNFWTERHAATVLSGFVVAYEVLGEADLALKATDAFSALYKMQNEPSDEIVVTGGLMHTSASHGEGGEELITSPWMSALLIDSVERYYIHSGDSRVKDFTYKLADYMTVKGLYSTDVLLRDALPSVSVPYYIAGENLTEQQQDFDPWSNVEHNLDVSKIFALAHFFDSRESTVSKGYLMTFSELFNTGMQFNILNWIRPGASSLKLGEFQGGKPVFRLSPPRKFNWWFRITANLDWLIGENTQFLSTRDINTEEVKNPFVELKLNSNIQDANENEVVTFTLGYKNTGEANATNTIILNQFLTNEDYYEVIPSSISDNGVFGNGMIYWNIGSVNESDSERYLTFQVKVLKPDAIFSKERPSPSLISLASTRYGSDNSNSIQPSTNIWDLGQYTHNKISNTAVVTTSSFIEKPMAITFDKSIALDEDTSTTYLFSTNSLDAEIEQYKIIKQPLHGEISGTFPELTYTPDPDFFGGDSVELFLNQDPLLERGIIYFNVLPVNDEPYVVDLSLTTNKNIPLEVVFNVSDVDGDILTFSITEAPNNGSIVGEGSSIVYQPNSDYLGNDEFTYQVFDGQSYHQGVVNINIEDIPAIKGYIENLLEEGGIANWIGSYILGRVDLFKEAVDEITLTPSLSGLELLKAKHKANSLLITSFPYLTYVTDVEVNQLIKAQIKEMLFDTSSSDNSQVNELSEYLYEQSVNASLHTYVLFVIQEYVIEFSYYLNLHELNPSDDSLLKAVNVINKAETFILPYIISNPDNSIYHNIFEYFNQALRPLTIDNTVFDGAIELKAYIENSVESGSLSNWIGHAVLGKVELFDKQVLVVDDLVLAGVGGIELLKAKHLANSYLMSTYSYLSYAPEGEVLQTITNKIKSSLFNTLSSGNPETIEFSDFLYIQMRDNTVHPYFLSVTKEHLTYIDYYIEINDMESAKLALEKAKKTLNYYLVQSPENEVYIKISTYYETLIISLVN